jgi:hypothetical protein
MTDVTVILFALATAFVACSTRDVSASVPVLEGDTVQDRAQIAKDFVTSARIGWLAQQARTRYPWLSEDQLRTLRLTISPESEVEPQDESGVRVFVTMRDSPAQAAEVVEYCRGLVAKALEHEKEVRARGPRHAKPQ